MGHRRIKRSGALNITYVLVNKFLGYASNYTKYAQNIPPVKGIYN